MPKQPTAKPTRKVGASALGAAVAGLAGWALHMPPEAVVALGVVCTFAAGYVTPEA